MVRLEGRFLAAVLCFCWLWMAGAPLANARKSKPAVRYDGDAERFASARYAALDAASCHAELARRGISFSPELDAQYKSVLAPVRVRDRISGVLFRTAASESERQTTPYEVFDCRLVLSLSDWSRLLLSKDIDEVLFFSAFRPPPKPHADIKPASRHPGGLAIDVFRFGKRKKSPEQSREWIDIERDFQGRLKQPVCPQAPSPGANAKKKPKTNTNTKILRGLVCETADAHLFSSILTPNYDRAHKNHLHLEIVPNVSWHLLR